MESAPAARPVRLASCCGLAVQDRDTRARLQLVLSVDHDLLVGLEAGIDQCLAVADLRDLDRADLPPCCRD